MLDLLKLREGPRVPEVVEQRQGAIEPGLHGWSAGRLHVCLADAFGAVAVLCEDTRSAQHGHQRGVDAAAQDAHFYSEIAVETDERIHLYTEKYQRARYGLRNEVSKKLSMASNASTVNSCSPSGW